MAAPQARWISQMAGKLAHMPSSPAAVYSWPAGEVKVYHRQMRHPSSSWGLAFSVTTYKYITTSKPRIKLHGSESSFDTGK